MHFMVTKAENKLDVTLSQLKRGSGVFFPDPRQQVADRERIRWLLKLKPPIEKWNGRALWISDWAENGTGLQEEEWEKAEEEEW